jgi:hypothetical protein
MPTTPSGLEDFCAQFLRELRRNNLLATVIAFPPGAVSETLTISTVTNTQEMNHTFHSLMAYFIDRAMKEGQVVTAIAIKDATTAFDKHFPSKYIDGSPLKNV